MAEGHEGELYGKELVSMLEIVWGEGWLSPGGPEELARLLEGHDIRGARVLDIGCGVGGLDFLLATEYGAGEVVGIDVEDTVLDTARMRAIRKGLSDRVTFMKVVPGPLMFPDQSFDVVFSKDAIVHIADKHGLMRDIHRILKPGGLFVASDWLIGHDDAPSPEMKAYLEAEGLDFGMASPSRYRHALEKAGFEDIRLTSRNEWYRDAARRELAGMKGPLYQLAVERLGKSFVDHNIGIWERMIVVLDTGEHCPHHLSARKPEKA